MKELWIEAHDELIEEYLEAHPDATEDEAYEKTTPLVDARFNDNFADMIDYAKDRIQEGGR